MSDCIRIKSAESERKGEGTVSREARDGRRPKINAYGRKAAVAHTMLPFSSSSRFRCVSSES